MVDDSHAHQASWVKWAADPMSLRGVMAERYPDGYISAKAWGARAGGMLPPQGNRRLAAQRFAANTSFERVARRWRQPRRVTRLLESSAELRERLHAQYPVFPPTPSGVGIQFDSGRTPHHPGMLGDAPLAGRPCGAGKAQGVM